MSRSSSPDEGKVKETEDTTLSSLPAITMVKEQEEEARGREEKGQRPEEGKKEQEEKEQERDNPIEYPVLSLSSPPEAPDVSSTELGWAALAIAVRDIDEPLVKDFKEDIDTILVFAGLYSAVLTGLLAQSITNLQQDPSTVTNYLLTQILNQTHSYFISASFLNSSAPPPTLSPPPFAPSLAAKRVNTLWFASLMLSLISASFGILVKQWLREYLAVIYSSPEARVRVRHFREPGLRHWKVFGIAALLPLLLQLALALFFIGLCFFTLDIHTSVGYTTIPLAIAWAILFIAVSFAPTVSPRCPYKTPLLKYLTKFLRHSLYRSIIYAARLRSRDTSPLQTNSGRLVPAKWTLWLLDYDEEDAAPSESSDLEALLELDTVQQDDRLLQKIFSVLHERHTSLDDIISFVLRVADSRLQFVSATSESKPLSRPLPPLLDLTKVRPRTCTILTDNIAQALEIEAKKVPISIEFPWKGSLKDGLAFLCVKFPCLLSEKTNNILRFCASGDEMYRMRPFVSALRNDVETSQHYALGLHLQEHLRPMLLKLSAYDFNNFLYALSQLYCNCDRHQVSFYGDVFIAHRHNMTPVLANNFMDLVVQYLHQQTLVPEARWTLSHSNIFTGINNIWGAYYGGLWYDGYIECFKSLLLHPFFGPEVSTVLYHHTHFNASGPELFERTFKGSGFDIRPGLLMNVARSLETYLRDEPNFQSAQEPRFCYSLIRFLVMQFSMVKWVLDENSMSSQSFFGIYQPHWKSMFDLIASALHTYMERTKPSRKVAVNDKWAKSIPDLARSSLRLAQDIEVQWRIYLKFWNKDPDQMGLFLEDTLLDELCRLVPPEEATAHREARKKFRGDEPEVSSISVAPPGASEQTPYNPRADEVEEGARREGDASREDDTGVEAEDDVENQESKTG